MNKHAGEPPAVRRRIISHSGRVASFIGGHHPAAGGARLAWVWLVLAIPATAAEITSNGLGGGRWDDPATWRGNALPGPGDEVVIARDDIVTFNRNDDGKVTCKQLFLDPKGRLTFQAGGKRVLCVDGPVEGHGTVHLDASQSADDHFELRLVAVKDDRREVRLKKGAALTLIGKANLPDGKRNVVVASQPPEGKKDAPLPAVGNLVNKEGGVSIEFQHARFDDLSVYLTGLDNTGSKPGERANVNGCRFNGRARITFNGCDTPAITNSVFDETPGGFGGYPYAGVHLYGSPLAEVKNVTARGRYYGVMGQVQSESVVSGCLFEKCHTGLYWYGTNGMLKDLTVRGCETGITTTSMSGSFESILVEKCKVGYLHAGATVQATGLVITDVPKDGTVIDYVSGALTLLNCPITPDQVKMNLPALAAVKPDYVPVEWLHFLVIGVKGKLPADSIVTTRTVGLTLPPGAEDPNVRNSPAPLVNGRTPLPKTTQALTLKGQRIDTAGKVHPAPAYTIGIYAPPTREGEAPRLISSGTVTPSTAWYRSRPDAPTPTLEVDLP